MEDQDQTAADELILHEIQKRKARLARLRRAELQRKEWMVRASREARMNLLKRNLERADLRTREKHYMNRAVIPSDVRPADVSYTDQLITEKKFPDEAEADLNFYALPNPNIPAFHPGVHVIPVGDD